MWWKNKSKKCHVYKGTSCQASTRSSTGKSTSNSSLSYCEHASDSLDRSRHRCSSIESLLSLVDLSTHDNDSNNRRSTTPRVCNDPYDPKEVAKESRIPTEVHTREDRTVGNTDKIAMLGGKLCLLSLNAPLCPHTGENNRTTNGVLGDSWKYATIGLDIFGSSIACDSAQEEVRALANDAASVNSPSSQADGLPADSIDPATTSIECTVEGFEKTFLPHPTREGTIDKTQTGTVERNVDSCNDDRSSSSDGCWKARDGSSSNSVRFGVVEVHEHDQELSESSVPLRGPPLGLGWNRSSYRKFSSVNDHKDETSEGRLYGSLTDLHLPSAHRVDILLKLGYTQREIQSSVREAGIVRTKRIHSARFSSRNKSFMLVRNALRKCRTSKDATATRSKKQPPSKAIPRSEAGTTA